MASAGSVDVDGVAKKMREFSRLSGCKNDKEMTSKAHGKMVTDCLGQRFKKEDIKAVADASVFPACKVPGKPHMELTTANVDKYLCKMSHEVAKRQTKNTKIAESAQEVQAVKAEIAMCICGGGPCVKETKASKTGNVGGLTDTSKYTGAHKERFDDSGKGKGVDGREVRVTNTGYVDNYKGSGSYGKK